MKKMFFDVLIEYSKRNKAILFSTLIIGVLVAYFAAEFISYSVVFEGVIGIIVVYIITIISYVIYNHFNVIVVEFYYINGQPININEKTKINFVSLWGAKRLIYNKDELNIDKVFSDLDEMLLQIKSMKEIHYFSITSIPINGHLGYKLGRFNKMFAYNFNQKDLKWESVQLFDKKYTSTIIEFNKDLNSDEFNLVISLSNQIKFEQLADQDLYTYMISYDSTIENQFINYDEIFNDIKDLLLEYKVCHIYLSSNSAFPFYLGTKLYNRNYSTPMWYEWGGINSQRYTRLLDSYKEEIIDIEVEDE